MRHTLTKILLIAAILITSIGGAFTPQKAGAQTATSSGSSDPTAAQLQTESETVIKCTLWSWTVYNCVLKGTAALANLSMSMAGAGLTVTGTLLNGAMNATLHISAFVTGMQDPVSGLGPIELTWKTIRDFSSIAIIFMLLYASICMILGVGGPNLGNLIKNVVIAGLLINFSLFFTKIAIDASNMVSLAFYDAITTGIVDYKKASEIGLIDWKSAFNDGGISNIFQQALKVQAIPAGDKNALTGATVFKVIISGVMGTIVMVMAAFSFLFAAIAFIFRIAILFLVMAFSPVYFIGMVLPDVKKHLGDKWMAALYSQCVFMPVYLVLLYVAMKIITSPGFTRYLNPATITGNSGVVGVEYVGIIMLYTIAMILINAPMVAAIMVGGESVGLAKKWTDGAKKWGQGAIKGGAGFTAQHTFGRGAKALQDRLAESSLATRFPNMTVLTNKALGGVAGGTFGGTKGGYADRFKKFSEARSKYGIKGLKVSDAEKAAYVARGMSKWDSDTAEMQVNLARARIIAANKTMSPEGQRQAQKRVDDLIKQIEDRNSTEKQTEQTEYLKKEVLKKKQERFADKLGGRDLFTTKARKDAADAIRKELKKGKDKKLIDAIQEAFGDDKGKGDKGGDGDKDKK